VSCEWCVCLSVCLFVCLSVCLCVRVSCRDSDVCRDSDESCRGVSCRVRVFVSSCLVSFVSCRVVSRRVVLCLVVSVSCRVVSRRVESS
jgi:hypothetical protein